jgi:hypothetical protein
VDQAEFAANPDLTNCTSWVARSADTSMRVPGLFCR